MTPTPNPPALLPVIESDRVAACDLAAVLFDGLFAQPMTNAERADWAAGKNDETDFVQAFARHRLQSTPAEPKVSREAVEQAMDPWRRVWAIAFAPFDNGPGRGVGRWKEDDGAARIMPTAWPTIADLRRLSALSNPPADGDDLAWFSERPTLSLDHYSPWFCDDDDQSVEWRVMQVSGPRNDREWDIVGRGETAAEAIKAARAFFHQSAPPSAPLGAGGEG